MDGSTDRKIDGKRSKDDRWNLRKAYMLDDTDLKEDSEHIKILLEI